MVYVCISACAGAPRFKLAKCIQDSE